MKIKIKKCQLISPNKIEDLGNGYIQVFFYMWNHMKTWQDYYRPDKKDLLFHMNLIFGKQKRKNQC